MRGKPAPDFRLLFESIPGLYLVLSPDLTIVGVSDAYLGATMTTRAAILGRGLFDVFPDNPDDPIASGERNLKASLDRVRQSAVPDAMAVQKYDVRRPDSDGGGFEERFWSPVNSPVFNPSGELVYIIHRVEDVTEFVRLKHLESEQEKTTVELRTRAQKMEAEVYLRAQEVSEVNRQLSAANTELAALYERMQDRHDSLVERAVFGIFQATLEGRFLSVNPAMVKMLAYDSAQELQRVGLLQLYSDASSAADLLRRLREREQFTGVEAVWRCKSGEPIRVRISGRSVHGSRILEAFVEDITERHRLEAQLRQSQKMEAIGQLAGGVAHDFNNMLTAILGYSAMLAEQIGPDKRIGQDLAEITSAAERAAALTRQLLAFSRKQVVKAVPVDLSQIVRGIEPMLRRLIGEHIAIETTLAGDLHPVLADSPQVEQVMLNLVVNSRDAMPKGGVISIETRNVELDTRFAAAHAGSKPGSYAMVSVSDGGVGMSPEVQAKIFEPFFTTKEQGKGTGLGLAAVYGIVKQSGGYVGVESVAERGTTFRVYLPRTEQAAEPVHARRSVEGSQPGTETILLVEDERGVRRFIKRALQRHGYRIVEAESAEAALATLESLEAPIHLLLTDVTLTGMDGPALAARFESDRPHVPVLFMSGYPEGTNASTVLVEPGAHLLQKPFSAQVLLAAIRDVLDTTGG